MKVTRRIWPALLATMLMLPAAPAHAGARLGLHVRSLSRAPSSTRRGDPFTVAYKVTRSGSGLKRAALHFYLSRTSKKKGALRLAGGPSLRGLARKRSVKGKAHLRVAATASGRYRLLACVEAVKTRARRRLSAPCRASAGTLTVEVPAEPAPPGPVPDGTPVATPPPAPAATPTPEPGVDPASPLATANPLDVTPALDTAHRAVATIGEAGGTLDATGADGTTFELSVPAGALVSDLDVSMTPLTSVAGMPFDSLAGGVDLQPDGLQLLKPARLTITPGSATPAPDDQSFFAYEGAGKDFHNYPPVSDSSTLAIDLPHFTGGGLASGTAAQRAALDARMPAEYAAQYEAESASAIRALRDGTMDSSQFGDAFTTIGENYYTHVVRPRLQSATTDDTLIELATTTFAAWLKGLQDLGMGTAFTTQANEGLDLLRAGLKNAFDKSYAGCLNHDVGQVRRFVAVGHFAALLGAGIGEEEITAKLANCLHFRLDLVLHLERTGTQTHDLVLLDASSTAMPLTLRRREERADGRPAVARGRLELGRPHLLPPRRRRDADQAGARAPLGRRQPRRQAPRERRDHVHQRSAEAEADPRSRGHQHALVLRGPGRPGNPTGNGGSAARWFLTTMHSQFGTFETEFLSPFTTWNYVGSGFPWATAFAETTSPYDGGLRMILTHDPASG